MLSVSAQRNFDGVEIKATHVDGNVYMLEGAGGNIGVSVGDDGILIIDDQFAPLAPKIEAALAALNKGNLKFVLNSHWHGDHTGGNAHFGSQATIVAHQNVRTRLAGKPNTPDSALPVITFEKSLSLHFNGEEIRVIHMLPGHTDGDSVIHFTESNVVHMGDQFFVGRFPYIDLGSGGSVEGYLGNVEMVLNHISEETKIIPGHGPLATVEDLRMFHRMLKETTGKIKRGFAAGKSMDQVKREGLSDEWDDWGAGFINTSHWIEIVYNYYSTQ